MRELLALFVALLFAASMIASAGCSKKEEAPKPAAEPVKPPEAEKKAEEVKPGEAAKASEAAKPVEAPAPSGEKAKAEKPKASKPMRAYGTVAAYEAGKTIKVKGAKEKEWTFDIAPDAKIKGEVKEGAKVRVVYSKKDDKMVATSISVAVKKAKTGKK
jgi:hypothetical protein